MKRFTIICLTFLAACSQEKESNRPEAQIEGKITAIPAGTRKIYLNKMGIRGPELVDSAELDGDKFSFSVPADSQHLYRLEVASGFLPLFMEAGKHELTADFKQLYQSAKYSNSPLTDQMRNVESVRLSFEEIAQNLYHRHQAAGLSGNTKSADSAFQAYENLRISYKGKIKHIIDSIGPGPVAYLCTSMLTPDDDFSYLDSLAVRFEKEKPGHVYTQKMRNFMEVPRRLAIGKKVPDMQLPNPGGKVLSISSFRGKWLLLDFWASWCKPCRAESPFLVSVHNLYKSKGLEILSVSLDADRDAWMKAIVQDDLNWAHVSDLKGWESESARLFAIQAIPASYLINPEGVITAKNLRGKDLEQKLMEIFR